MTGPPSYPDLEIIDGNPVEVTGSIDSVDPPDKVLTKPYMQPDKMQAVGLPPGEIERTSAQVAFTPYEDPSALTEDVASLGVASDKLPAYNLQAVDNKTRLLADILFDKPEEKLQYFKQQLGTDWKIETSPADSTKFIFRKKGMKYWGVNDPGGGGIDERGKDILENIVPISQAIGVGTGPLMGALIAGNIQAVRQLAKQSALPGSSVNGGEIAMDMALGAIPGGSGKALTGGARSAAKGAQTAFQAGKTVVARSANTTMWQRIKNIPSMLDSPDWIAREYGASGKAFDDFRKKSITESIDFLQQNSPEYVAARKAGSLSAEKDLLQKLREDTGEALGDIYKDPSRTVAVRDIFNTSEFQDLYKADTTRFVKKGAQTVKVDAKVQKKIREVRRNFVEELATAILPEGPNTNNILNMFRNKTLGKSDLAQKFGTTTDVDTMMKLLDGQQIPMGELFAIRMGNTETINFGKQQGVHSSLSSARKMVVDSMKEATNQSLVKELGPVAAADIIKQSEIFHNLSPVVAAISRRVGTNKAEKFNPIKTLPSWMLSTPRFAAALARNTLQNPDLIKLIKNGGMSFPLPQGVNLGGGKQALSMLQRMGKGGQFLTLRELADKTFNVDNASAAEFLPRETSTYFDNPDTINQLGQKVDSPEYVDALTKQYARGDRDGFSNTLSMLASDNEESFAPAPYKSLVMQNGKPIITDMHDREQYRQFITKTVLSPKERFKILRALNLGNEMVKPPYEMPTQPNRVPEKESTEQRDSIISRVSDNLKRITDAIDSPDTVTLDDGNKRQDYGY